MIGNHQTPSEFSHQKLIKMPRFWAAHFAQWLFYFTLKFYNITFQIRCFRFKKNKFYYQEAVLTRVMKNSKYFSQFESKWNEFVPGAHNSVHQASFKMVPKLVLLEISLMSHKYEVKSTHVVISEKEILCSALLFLTAVMVRTSTRWQTKANNFWTSLYPLRPSIKLKGS